MNNATKHASYTAANALPVKLFLSDGAKELRPVHISWYPTNECNLNCKFCSCSNRDRKLTMDIFTAINVIHDFADLGCKAVSISGGGEPLCHPHLADMIAEFHGCGIKIGLVTNGMLLGRLDRKTLDMLAWCRISSSISFDDSYEKALDRVVEADVDWAFSHVVGRQPDIERIVKLVDYAERHEFSHVRLVGDLREPHAIDWSGIKHTLAGKDDVVIYQERKTFVASDRCLLGYVKPLIAPDWKMYQCCGVQYAMRKMSLDNPPELCMGDARDLDAIYGGPRHPFPVKCVRCYYEDHNIALQALTSDIAHEEFA